MIKINNLKFRLLFWINTKIKAALNKEQVRLYKTSRRSADRRKKKELGVQVYENFYIRPEDTFIAKKMSEHLSSVNPNSIHPFPFLFKTKK